MDILDIDFSYTVYKMQIPEKRNICFGRPERSGEIWQERAKQKIRSGARHQTKLAESTLARLQKEQDGLKAELLRVLTGSSNYDRDLLQSMLEENRKVQIETEETIRNLNAEASKEVDRMAALDRLVKNVLDWRQRFDSMAVDERRAVLQQLIDRIDISRGYRMKIQFKVSLEDFLGEEKETEKVRNERAS